MRHAGCWLAVGVAVLAGCAASGDEGESKGSTSDPACEVGLRVARDAWDLEPPAVFELAADVYEQRLARQRRDLGTVVSRTEDRQVREAAAAHLESREVTDPARVRLLQEEGAVMKSVGWGWQLWAFSQRALVDEKENAAYMRERNSSPFDRIVMLCSHQELGSALEADLDADPPGGAIVFKELGADPARGFVAVSPEGGATLQVDPPAGWESLSYPWVDTGTGEIVAVASRDEGFETAVVAGSIHSGMRVVFVPDAATRVECASRSPAGTLLVTGRRELGRSVVLEVDDTSGARELDVPVTNPVCPQAIDDGLVVLGGREVSDFGEITVLRGEPLQTERALTQGALCNDLVADISPGQDQVLTTATCADAADSGMYLRPLDGNKADHLLAGRVTVGAFSPDGEWVVLGHAGLGTDLNQDVRIWVMRLDGSGLHQVTRSAASYPVWTPEAL